VIISKYALGIIVIVMTDVLLIALIPYLFGFETRAVREKAILGKKLEERDLLSEHFLHRGFNGPPLVTFWQLNLNFEFLLLNSEHQSQDIFQP